MITRTVLLINSEPYVREVLQACLSHLAGWQVYSTGSPLEGLRYAGEDQPDAIVFDLYTFGMTSFTFLQRLRTLPRAQDIPVVLAATGAKWLDLKSLQEFQLAGVIDYSTATADLPRQIAKLLHWDEELQITP